LNTTICRRPLVGTLGNCHRPQWVPACGRGGDAAIQHGRLQRPRGAATRTQLEVPPGREPGRVAKPIFAELDPDKEHFVLLALNNKNRINGYGELNLVIGL